VPRLSPRRTTNDAALRLDKVLVLGIHDGRARVTATFRRAGKTVKVAKVVRLKAGQQRVVTLKATGAKLRTLRRLADSGALRTSVTARSFNGKYSARGTTSVRL
jgi:hypothetical protein